MKSAQLASTIMEFRFQNQLKPKTGAGRLIRGQVPSAAPLLLDIDQRHRQFPNLGSGLLDDSL